MLVGWYELITNSRRLSKQSIPSETTEKRISAVQFADRSPFAKTGILPEPSDSIRHSSLPEACDVSTRHEGTPANWFDEDYEEPNTKARNSRLEDIDEV